MALLLIPHLALFQMPYLHRLAPVAYGSTSKPNWSYLAVYRFLSYASFLLYLKQTFVALLDNDPGAHVHRHSHYLALLHLPHEQERRGTTRAASAIGEVLGALGAHPAVASVGWDVVICTTSLGAWAIARGLDVSRIADTAGIGSSQQEPQQIRHQENDAVATTTTVTAKMPAGRPRKTRKPTAKAAKEESKKGGSFDESQVKGPIPYGEEARPENPEAGAVGWTMFALGGLGVLAAGVLGATSEAKTMRVSLRVRVLRVLCINASLLLPVAEVGENDFQSISWNGEQHVHLLK